MAFVNLKEKEIQVKIVYYGPGRGGKTSNLEYIHRKFANRINSRNGYGQNPWRPHLFFDFLPFFDGDFHKKRFDIGEINWLNQMIRIN